MQPSDLPALASELSTLLRLAVPPIGIAFQADGPTAPPRYESNPPPPTVDGRTGAVPAGCFFWFKAVDRVFSTLAEDHANCSVGSYTHGFETLAEAATKADTGALFESGWVTEADVPGIAHVAERPKAIVYGPLAEMTVIPDVVFLRLNAKQAMVLDDALGRVRFEGKPQCHIVAIAKEAGDVALSVGCMLSRVRTGMNNNELTCAIPSRRLSEVVEKLRRNSEIERTVAMYAAQDAARFRLEHGAADASSETQAAAPRGG
jgi:uncharacterized protein (DUF169 family)